MKLEELAPELIEEILIYCDPIAVSKFAQTNSQMRSIVYSAEDLTLWRELYLAQELDDPRTCIAQDGTARPHPIDWKNELQRIIRARTVIENPTAMKVGELPQTLDTILSLIHYVSPRTRGDLWDISKWSDNLFWIFNQIGASGFVAWLKEQQLDIEERQVAARLYTYLGLSTKDVTCAQVFQSLEFIYGGSVGQHGSLSEKGRVDWEVIQKAHHLISIHIVPKDLDKGAKFNGVLYQMCVVNTQIVIPEGVVPDQESDWAGVSGQWEVAFCILDPLDDNDIDDDDATVTFNGAHELFRTMALKLSITSAEDDPLYPTRPILKFSGKHDGEETPLMTGMIRITPDNQVCWKFVLDEEMRGEGIHVGGLQSWFGVLGVWRNDESDIGPFWMRKQQETPSLYDWKKMQTNDSDIGWTAVTHPA